MKKITKNQSRKLVLHRETVKDLEQRALALVDGGTSVSITITVWSMRFVTMQPLEGESNTSCA